jgi:hypothetical protein
MKVITGAQIREGRLLLQWSHYRLAERAKVSATTIKRSQAADGEPMITIGQADAIQRALESGGVVFVEDNGDGPGVRLRK